MFTEAFKFHPTTAANQELWSISHCFSAAGKQVWMFILLFTDSLSPQKDMDRSGSPGHQITDTACEAEIKFLNSSECLCMVQDHCLRTETLLQRIVSQLWRPQSYMKVTVERRDSRRWISATVAFFSSDTAQFNEAFGEVSWHQMAIKTI